MNTEPRILELRYIANTKPQPGYDERVAFGHDGDAWAYVFPESVLTAYFSGTTTDPSQATTLYGVLGVGRNANREEIQSAFRRLAKSWHADINTLYQDEVANNAFIRVKNAYDLLSNPDRRARYDAGLALEASLKKRDLPIKQDLPQGYKPARRCGYVLAEGQENSQGKFVVTKILDWQPITDDRGRVLVTAWDMSLKNFTETWVQVAQRG